MFLPKFSSQEFGDADKTARIISIPLHSQTINNSDASILNFQIVRKSSNIAMIPEIQLILKTVM